MSATKVVTGEVRGSYLNLWEPRANQEGQTPKYSMTLLIPKSDTATLAKIKAAQEAAIAAKWPSKRPARIDLTLHDGDGVKPSTGEPFPAECKGHMVMSVSSKTQPGVVDQRVQPVIDRTMFVSGDYFRVSINGYAYEVNGKRGVSFGLNNVQFMRKGEPLGSVARAEDDFTPVATTAADEF
jgi:hypothetical protein